MTRLSPARRSGVTLTEVLIAMFIMAVGMIALLTLFPLGAMQVGQALRDDRCAQAALQADGYMRTYWRHQVAAELGDKRLPREPFFWAMDDPNLWVVPPYSTNMADWVAPATTPSHADEPYRDRSPVVYDGVTLRMTFLASDRSGGEMANGFQLPVGNNAPRTTPAETAVSPTMLSGAIYTGTPPVHEATLDPGANQVKVKYVSVSRPTVPGTQPPTPSYPVLVDPTGYDARGTTDPEQFWLARNAAGNSQLLVPRRQLNPVTRGPLARGLSLQVAGLTDDITFLPSGTPDPVALGRQGRYSWAALVQRPDNSVRDVANLTVLVFDGRPALPAKGDEYLVSFPAGPSDPPIVAAASSRQLNISVINRSIDEPVLLRRGGWIMDASLTTGVAQSVKFYRVAGFVENGADTNDPLDTSKTRTKYAVDLETPLEFDVTPTSRLFLLAGLAEVFVRPQLQSDSNR